MANPVVWADAKARIAAAAATLDIEVVWPNEQDLGRTGTYVRPQIQSSGARPIELKGGVWREDGTLWLHVLIPSGDGFDDGNTTRYELAQAFRHVTNAPAGLTYRDIAEDPDDNQESGNWCRLSAAISYSYQDA